jgi:hypothetical protein
LVCGRNGFSAIELVFARSVAQKTESTVLSCTIGWIFDSIPKRQHPRFFPSLPKAVNTPSVGRLFSHNIYSTSFKLCSSKMTSFKDSVSPNFLKHQMTLHRPVESTVGGHWIGMNPFPFLFRQGLLLTSPTPPLSRNLLMTPLNQPRKNLMSDEIAFFFLHLTTTMITNYRRIDAIK